MICVTAPGRSCCGQLAYFAGRILGMLDAVWLILYAVQADSSCHACVRPRKQTLCLIQHCLPLTPMAGLSNHLMSRPLLQPVLHPSCCYTHSCCPLDVSVIAAHASMQQSCRYLNLLSSSCMKRLGGGFAGSGPLLRDSDVQTVLGSNVLPVFRLLHAEVAAAAAVLAKNIRLATGHTPVSLCCTMLHLAESCRAIWGDGMPNTRVDTCLLGILLHAQCAMQEGVLQVLLVVHGTIAAMYLQLRCHAQIVVQHQSLLDGALCIICTAMCT